MPDVILPVLNERDAIPWVLERMPAGYAPIVVDNGSTDGSGELAASLGARVVTEPAPGFGAACFAGLTRGGRATSCASWTATRPSTRASCRASPTRCSRATRDLMLGARRPDGARRLAAARAGGEPVLALELRRRTKVPLRDLGPMRAARREALLELGIRDRRFGWPLEMVLRAAAAGLDDPRGRRRLPPARRRSKVTGTVRGTARAVRDMTRLLR